MTRWLQSFYQLLLVLSCLSMVAAFVSIMLGVAVREFHWDIQGTDAWAGYSIAAALFLALPQTLRSGEHIRVTLLLQRLPARGQAVLEWWSLGAGLALALTLAWYSCRLVWLSYTTHDISPAADATPLWIPQLSMALGCIGFVVSFIDAIVTRLRGADFFARNDGELAHAE